MNFVSVTSQDDYFEQAMHIYHEAFDEDIREDIGVFEAGFQIKEQDARRFHFICAVNEKRVLGFINFLVDPYTKTGYIVYLVVDEKARGQQLAKQLMNVAFQTMEQSAHSIDTIFLECEKDNNGVSPLDAFYKKFGFELSSVNYHQPGLRNDIPVPMNLYIKHVAQNPHYLDDIITLFTSKYHQYNGIELELLKPLVHKMKKTI